MISAKTVSLVATLAALGGAAVAAHGPPGPTPPAITVYKSPSCGCCKQWIAHHFPPARPLGAWTPPA